MKQWVCDFLHHRFLHHDGTVILCDRHLVPFDKASEWFSDLIDHFQEVLKFITAARFCFGKYVLKLLLFEFAQLLHCLLTDCLLFLALFVQMHPFLFCWLLLFSLELPSSLKHLHLTNNCEGSIRSSSITERCFLLSKKTVNVVASFLTAIPGTDSVLVISSLLLSELSELLEK